MNQLQKIVKNIIFLLFGGFVTSILSVILSIYIARFLGDVIFGQYSFVVAFVALFSVFLDLGYETLLIRDVAKDKSKASNYLNNIISFRVIISLSLFTIIFLLINIFNYPENIKFLIYLFGASQIILSLSNIFRVLFRSFERMDYEAWVNIFTIIIRCSVGLVLLFIGYGIIEIAYVFLFTSIIDFFLSFLICEKRFVKLKTRFDITFFKSTLKSALSLGSIAIFSLIYVRIDTVMLEFMKGDAVVGWYNAAYNLILGFSPIPLLFLNGLLPFMAYTSEKSIDSLKEVYKKAFKFLFIFGLPISLGIFLLADKFIILFYSQDFINSILALRILSFDILLKFLYFCVFFVLVSVDKQNKMAIIAGSGALINIVLNLFLIPEYSLLGAAIATIITEVFILVMYVYLASVNNLKIPINKIVFKPVIACGVMAIFIYYFNNLDIFLLVIFSAILYFIMLFILKDFSKEDKELFKNLIKRKIE